MINPGERLNYGVKERLQTLVPALSLRTAITAFAAYFLLAIFVALIRPLDFRTADRSSAKMAPTPAQERRAVVLVYKASAFSWRGWFSIHTWIAIKDKDAPSYEVMQVIGWRLRERLSAVMFEPDLADRRWFGNEPSLLLDLRGEAAEAAIPKIRKAAADYPYRDRYRAWPGPNSNTFISFILRSVPELGIALPPNAIGRDWLVGERFWSRSESGTGVQVSLWGLAGFTAGLRDGLEVQLLGLDFGVDLLRPALKLPIIGRVGMTTASLPPSLPVDLGVDALRNEQGQAQGEGDRRDEKRRPAPVQKEGDRPGAQRQGRDRPQMGLVDRSQRAQ